MKADDERIFVNAKINGQPVRFAFDTGMGTAFLLTSTAAQKLNLEVTPPPADAQIGPGQFRTGWTEPQKLDFGFTNFEASFAVLEIPASLKPNLDGTLGWPAVSNDVLSLDWVTHTVNVFTNNKEKFSGWVKCRIQTNSDLTLELPGGKNLKEIIALDSGASFGIELNPHKWREWKTSHADQPTTLEAYYMPNPGLVVSEEAWASKIVLGALTLTDVPVMQASSSDVALHSAPQTQFVATLGFAALKRLDMVVDGKQGVAYLRPKITPPLPYEHNRLGAIFVPQDLQSNDLVAHVINSSPAFEAGIRDDDVLLNIGNLDCTKWRTDPNVLPLSRFWDGPGGTKLKFTLKRGDAIFKTTATLRNILPPDPAVN